MMSTLPKRKKIAAVFNPPAPHMVGDGFKVHNFFPGGYKINMSPFYMLDYNAKIEFPASPEPRGVGVHPHRGFETVTIAYHGAVSHHDSAGNSDTIYPGDVQWMTAGSGILHKEYHEKEFTKRGGFFQMVQLWVNLPAKNKMCSPKYQGIKNENIAKFLLPNNGGKIEVIAGNYMGTKGSATTFTPIEMYNTYLNKDTVVNFNFPSNFNTSIVVIEGELVINETETAKTNQMVYFKNEGESIELKALANCILLILSGEPINEPIVSYGPFLMNKPEEIQQAIDDYNLGKFGFLAD